MPFKARGSGDYASITVYNSRALVVCSKNVSVLYRLFNVDSVPLKYGLAAIQDH